MINLGSVLGAVASGMLSGGRSARHGRGGFGYSTARSAVGLSNLLGVCYGDDSNRFKKWSRQQDSMSAINQDVVHETINKGSWYDLKPEETAATTSSLGPGIIEINMDAVAPPPIPNEGSVPFHEEAPPPPLPPGDGPEPIPRQNSTRQVDSSANPLEFLEVPEEEMEESLGLKALRIIISAAHADGVLHDKERAMLETHLKGLGPEERELAKSEISNPRPMNEIVVGIDALEDRKFIFGLAAMALRADDKITPEENRFIRDLGKELRLDKTTAMEIIKASKQ
ncbi:MAG: DUF533 domain-containing protein [Nitrospinota bacterium]|nr:DUF533 domain-containing protein [Nitrospinota bacterium]